MNAETLKALRASIAKWEANAKAPTPEDYKVDSLDCPLCALFWDNQCYRCPVFERTGQPYCRDTPYTVALHAKNVWSVVPKSKICKDDAHSCARDEVDFLRSLLPSETPNVPE
jgi:hypothetical protein